MHRLRFIFLQLAILWSPISDWLDRLAWNWADRRLLAQVEQMRELVKVATHEENPHYGRDLHLAVLRYRETVEGAYYARRKKAS